jgi:hypothetical protein
VEKKNISERIKKSDNSEITYQNLETGYINEPSVSYYD